jgi:two-component system cell cycle response regulator
MTKILIIEDNKDNLQLMVYLLTKNGYSVMTAMDGQKGIECAKKDLPDLILCDIQMPILDGFQVLKALQKDEKLKTTPIIAVTAYAMVGDREKILAAGFNAYIPKPIDPDLFVKEIEQQLPKNLRSEEKIEVAPTLQTPQKKQNIMRGMALVIDDNFENRELSKNLLESIGFQVKTASNTQKGFEILQTEKPALILSDFHMPDMTGLDFLKLIRKNSEWKTLPFVMVSSTIPTKQQIEEIEQLNSKGFIARPIDPAEFLKIINQIYFEKRKVLIIEDNKDNLYLMVYLLTENDFLPIVTTTGDEGIESAKQEKPNLIICDILLPNKNGYVVANTVKKMDLDIPMLAVTALTMKDDIDKIFESGFDDYIEKPIDPIHFIQQVKSLLSIETHKKNEEVPFSRGKAFVIGKITEMVKAPLTMAGFEVTSFKNANMAQNEMKTTLPDFIVIDNKDMSFIQTVRNSELFQHLPLVIISDTKMLSENPLDRCVPTTIESDAFLKTVEDIYNFSKIQQRMNELENMIEQLKDRSSLEAVTRALHSFLGSPMMFGRNELIQPIKQLDQFIKTLLANDEAISKQNIADIQEQFLAIKNIYNETNLIFS